jgi:hypothetical protein
MAGGSPNQPADGRPRPAQAPSPRLTSARLFFWATLTFAWTAASLFWELPSRDGLLGRIGWGGLLAGGPATVLLVVLALRRYSSEVAAAHDPAIAQESAPPTSKPR